MESVFDEEISRKAIPSFQPHLPRSIYLVEIFKPVPRVLIPTNLSRRVTRASNLHKFQPTMSIPRITVTIEFGNYKESHHLIFGVKYHLQTTTHHTGKSTPTVTHSLKACKDIYNGLGYCQPGTNNAPPDLICLTPQHPNSLTTPLPQASLISPQTKTTSASPSTGVPFQRQQQAMWDSYSQGM